MTPCLFHVLVINGVNVSWLSTRVTLSELVGRVPVGVLPPDRRQLLRSGHIRVCSRGERRSAVQFRPVLCFPRAPCAQTLQWVGRCEMRQARAARKAKRRPATFISH
jgi:hypothetical protein